METIIAVLVIATIAVITPGPNNFIVMDIAAKNGFKASVRPIIAIISGACLLSLISWLGIATLLDKVPMAKKIIGLLGCAYLIFIGGTLIIKTSVNQKGHSIVSLPNTFMPIMFFQFLNPKAWVLTSTLILQLSSEFSEVESLVIQMSILLVVSACALTTWGLLGHSMSVFLKNINIRRKFDMVMGTLLVIPSCMILIAQI